MVETVSQATIMNVLRLFLSWVGETCSLPCLNTNTTHGFLPHQNGISTTPCLHCIPCLLKLHHNPRTRANRVTIRNYLPRSEFLTAMIKVSDVMHISREAWSCQGILQLSIQSSFPSIQPSTICRRTCFTLDQPEVFPTWPAHYYWEHY